MTIEKLLAMVSEAGYTPFVEGSWESETTIFAHSVECNGGRSANGSCYAVSYNKETGSLHVCGEKYRAAVLSAAKGRK